MYTQAQTAGVPPSGLFWVTSRDETLVYLEGRWKIPKAEDSAHIFVDVWLMMQTAEIHSQHFRYFPNRRHSCEMWRELHHPKSPSAAKHNPLSHNMSDIHSNKEWPLAASSPLARREITFICHISVLSLYSTVWYITALSEWGNDLLFSLQLSLIKGSKFFLVVSLSAS